MSLFSTLSSLAGQPPPPSIVDQIRELLVPASIALVAAFFLFSRKENQAPVALPPQSYASPSTTTSSKTHTPAPAPQKKMMKATEMNAKTEEPLKNRPSIVGEGAQKRRTSVQIKDDKPAEKTGNDNWRREAWRNGGPMSLSARRLAAQRGQSNVQRKRQSSPEREAAIAIARSTATPNPY